MTAVGISVNNNIGNVTDFMTFKSPKASIVTQMSSSRFRTTEPDVKEKMKIIMGSRY